MAELLTPHGVDVATRGLDLAGVFAAALQGGAIARTERLDLFGVVAVGVVSGLGGGLIRDTLLQHGTPVALTDVFYLPTALAGAFIAFLIHISQEAWDRLFTALDAAVIGFWAVAGAQRTKASRRLTPTRRTVTHSPAANPSLAGVVRAYWRMPDHARASASQPPWRVRTSTPSSRTGPGYCPSLGAMDTTASMSRPVGHGSSPVRGGRPSSARDAATEAASPPRE